jgi:hypothetical protein
MIILLPMLFRRVGCNKRQPARICAGAPFFHIQQQLYGRMMAANHFPYAVIGLSSHL